MKAKHARLLGLTRERRVGPEGAIVQRWVSQWEPIKMTYCGKDEAHGPHGRCPGLRAHPGVMIGKTNTRKDEP